MFYVLVGIVDAILLGGLSLILIERLEKIEKYVKNLGENQDDFIHIAKIHTREIYDLGKSILNSEARINARLNKKKYVATSTVNTFGNDYMKENFSFIPKKKKL